MNTPDSTPASTPERRPASEPPPSPESAGPRLSTIIVFVAGGLLFLILGVALAKPLGSLWERITAHTAEHEDDHDHNVQWYISGMHPWIIRPEPGFCPVCGMELTPLDPGMLSGELAIDPQIVANIGVRLAAVTEGAFRTSLHTVGTVEMDERLRREVVLRAPAFVESLHARYVGQRVAEGDVLAEIHSPEILGALNELLSLARRDPQGAEARATRQRLRVLGLQPEQIEAIEASGEAPWTVELRSPADGVVMALNGFEGQSIPAGGRLLELADLRKVWVLATVFESQLGRVAEGMPATAVIGKPGGKRLEGEVSFLYPTLDPRTRQGRMRLEFDNAEGHLKPGMFVRLEIDDTGEDDVRQIPREAVLDTGMRQIVFISRGDGRFEPREVRVGRESERGMVEILSGLSVNEMVVVSAQFLLDSESRLRESLLKLVMGDTAAEQRVQAPVEATPVLETMPAGLGAGLTRLLDAYLQAIDPLIHDHIDGVAAAAEEMRAAAASIHALGGLPPIVADLVKASSATMREAAAALAQARSVRSARIALRDLSDPLRELLHATGLPPEYAHEVHEIRCQMFPELGDMAWWFQRDTTTANPYMGQGMLTCQDRRFALPRTGQRPEETAAPETAQADEPSGTEVARGEITEFPSMRLGERGETALADALRAYLAIGERLVGDSLNGVRGEAGRLADALGRLADAGTADAPHAFHRDDLLGRMRAAAQTVRRSDNLADARMAFAILGEELTGLLQATGVPDQLGDDLIAARCHMFPTFGENGWWIQVAGPLENPLWGPAMLRCADQRRDLPRTAAMNGGHSHD
jgi:Cu(I)/Ag(I) efflux system membrane fusion protein